MIQLGGIEVHLPDGSVMKVTQEDVQPDPANRPGFIAQLRAERVFEGATALSRATLRMPGDTLDALPGSTDEEKSRFLIEALAIWLNSNTLEDGCELRAMRSGNRVQISRALGSTAPL